MYYFIIIIIIIFLVICLYYAIQDINKLSKKLNQKILDSNITKQIWKRNN
jgi:predicted Holliday junction resolvase-like endonuclease